MVLFAAIRNTIQTMTTTLFLILGGKRQMDDKEAKWKQAVRRGAKGTYTKEQKASIIKSLEASIKYHEDGISTLKAWIADVKAAPVRDYLIGDK